VSVESFSVVCTVFYCFFLTVGICRSRSIIVLDIYHGASVIMSCNLKATLLLEL
jgi:hypothetical protein